MPSLLKFKGENVLPETISQMRALIRAWHQNFYIRSLSQSIVGYALRPLYEVWNYVRTKCPLVRDPFATELLQQPLYTLRYGGDCDDHSILVGSMVASVGYCPRIVFSKSLNPEEYDHCYIVADDGRESRALDTTQPYGEEPPANGRMVVPVFGDM